MYKIASPKYWPVNYWQRLRSIVVTIVLCGEVYTAAHVSGEAHTSTTLSGELQALASVDGAAHTSAAVSSDVHTLVELEGEIL